MFQKFTHFIILLGVLFLPDMVYSKEYSDKIIAIVNDEVILKSEVQESINNLSSDVIKTEFSQLGEKEIINKVIDKLINDNLLLQAAGRFGINISDIALEQEVNNVAKKQNISITQLRNNIIQSGQDYTKFIENLRNKMTIEALFVTQFYSRANVTEEEVENFLRREQINDTGNVEYDLREFVINDEKKEINKDLINKIYSSVTNNGFNLTKKMFEDINISINVLGISKENTLPNIFVTALKNKILDKYTDVIESSKGYHILEINNVVNNIKYKFYVLASNENGVSLPSNEISLEPKEIDNNDETTVMDDYSDSQSNLDSNNFNEFSLTRQQQDLINTMNKNVTNRSFLNNLKGKTLNITL